MKFTKMHGLGNDYIYINELPDDPEGLSIRLSDRHFGIGSDGIVLILPSETADFRMRIFNADGSEAKMCGNGIRCVGKYVYDNGLTDKKDLTIQTESGIKNLRLFTGGNGTVNEVSVEMGKGNVSDDLSLTIKGSYPQAGRVPSGIKVGGTTVVTGTPVSVGNPHFVIFVDDAEAVPLSQMGPVLEKHSSFPGGVNVEFLSKTGPEHFRMRVWERGSGITMACGTGSCACVAAAASRGLCGFNTPVAVDLDGGTLYITVHEDMSITMKGPAASVFTGEI
ncbi:MAG: diaminopimelate epimerase [Parasporobacterium sp.]|nr:diaminopimelate epimerase [Parasporobacterium sp.]